MFEKLLEASDILSPSVTKSLHKAGLPVGKVSLKILLSRIDIHSYLIFLKFLIEEKELLRLTNPDNIRVETSYQGPRKKTF